MKKRISYQTTSLWDFPSQSHSDEKKYGNKNYAGVTPSFIIWNLLRQYTLKKDLVVDPMCGSGTSIDVCRELKRRVLGYDLNSTRPEIFNADARKLPLQDEKADFVFIDPPYSTHIKYSGKENCIGELHGNDPEYYQSMEKVIDEIYRILKPNRYMALYVSDSFEHKKGFIPIGFRLFSILEKKFNPVDIISVKRYNGKLLRNNWHTAAVENNFYLRGFNYLFIMYKGSADNIIERRELDETKFELQKRKVNK